jgi:hypothetical protein
MPKVLDLFDIKEVIKRIIKYLILGLTISFVAYFIPQKKLDFQEIGMLGIVAATSIAILDAFAPSVGVNARIGAGLGIGLELAGLFI